MATASDGTRGKTRMHKPAQPAPPLFWNETQTAERLGLALSTFQSLRKTHLFYEPDGSRVVNGTKILHMPLWSDDLVQLIGFARRITLQGVRELTDDEGMRVREGMAKEKRTGYLRFVESEA